MRVERKHHTDQQKAMKKIDRFVEQLMQRQFPGGVKIEDQRKSWADNEMSFSFRAKKGWFGARLGGRIVVTEDSIVLSCTVPPVVTTFISERKIRAVISRQLDDLFAA
jgi:Putative polyhydroxyalkanoic acid system protein (PHA_gran_rgn)